MNRRSSIAAPLFCIPVGATARTTGDAATSTSYLAVHVNRNAAQQLKMLTALGARDRWAPSSDVFIGDLEYTFLFSSSASHAPSSASSVRQSLRRRGLDRTSALPIALSSMQARYGIPSLIELLPGLHSVRCQFRMVTTHVLLDDLFWMKVLQAHPQGVHVVAHIQAELLVASGAQANATRMLRQCVEEVSQNGLSDYVSPYIFRRTLEGWSQEPI